MAGKPLSTKREDVEIRTMVRLGERQVAIAAKVGISQSVVSEIATGKAWRRAGAAS